LLFEKPVTISDTTSACVITLFYYNELMEEASIKILKEQYNGKYDTIKLREEALLIAAQLADGVKIREATGRNDGPWVGRILKVFGLGKGNPWCAAFVGKCYQMAGAKNLPPAGGAVRNWAKWKGCEAVKTPIRGDLFYLTT